MKYLKLNMVLLFICSWLYSMAQSPDIVGMEYYIDADPGFGNGTAVAITPDSISSTNFNLDISGLSPGLHYAYFRVKDANNRWSLITKKVIQKIEINPPSAPVNISGLEYFFNTDPGVGNGIAVSVLPEPMINTVFNVDISGLTAGFHKIYYRVINENGSWSISNIHPFVKLEDVSAIVSDIVELEYAIDSDPGIGNRNTIAVTPQTISNTVINLDISSLPAGYHKVYIWAKDANGARSFAAIHTFVKIDVQQAPDPENLVELEYYIDSDPGIGNGISVVLDPLPTADFTFGVDISSVMMGTHNLYIRIKDASNTWSLSNVFSFNVTEAELKILLESPFEANVMNTSLNTAGLLPTSQPYNTPPWNYSGDESVASIPNGDVVDWVLIETRNAASASVATGSTTTSRAAAFLLGDGSVVGMDGSNNLRLNFSSDTNNFIVIYHRNHLSVLSADELIFNAGVFSWDFTTAIEQAYNSGQIDLGGGYFGMSAGDANGDGMVNTTDLTTWQNEAGNSGYYNADLDMNMQVENNDKNEVWEMKNGDQTQVPD